MKLGVIVECPLHGVDHLVYERVIKNLHPNLDFEILSAGKDKSEMVIKCGSVASTFLSDNCDFVLIVWDLMPRFGRDACRKDDVEAIVESLKENSVPLEKVKLVCIEPELESWFLVDGNVLTSFKAQLWHPHPVKKFKGMQLPATSKDSKKAIANYLERKYNDYESAVRILQHIDDYDRIANNHESFGRLKGFIERL